VNASAGGASVPNPWHPGRSVDKEVDVIGISARARGHKGLAEEQPAAAKNVDQVVVVVDKGGSSKNVARLRPVGLIKE
jgi:tRNA-splicing ligase RtcB